MNSPQHKLLRIAIVGYGIAGIAAAILLRRLGHELVHFEQAANPRPVGAGLVLQKGGLNVLKRLGLYDRAFAVGAPIEHVVAETDRGGKIMELHYPAGERGLGIQRGTLFHLLSNADPGFTGLRSARVIDVDAERGELTFANGTMAGPFDLIIAADGAQSAIRTSMPHLVLRNRGYPWRAFIALVDDPGRRFGRSVIQRFSGDEHVSVWPVGAAEPGEPNRVNISVRVKQSNDVASAMARWKAVVERLFPVLAPLVEDARQPITAGYRDVRLRRYFDKRVAFLGDAAHAMSPQLGQGASMALLDAWSLARSIGECRHIADALATFDRRRRMHLSTYQRLSRLVTPIFQSDNVAATVFRDRAFYRLSRLPLMSRTMIRTLTTEQHGLFGTLRSTP